MIEGIIRFNCYYRQQYKCIPSCVLAIVHKLLVSALHCIISRHIMTTVFVICMLDLSLQQSFLSSTHSSLKSIYSCNTHYMVCMTCALMSLMSVPTDSDYQIDLFYGHLFTIDDNLSPIQLYSTLLQ